MIIFNIDANDTNLVIKKVTFNNRVLSRYDEEEQKTDLKILEKYIGYDTKLIYRNDEKEWIINTKITDVRYDINRQCFVVYFKD